MVPCQFLAEEVLPVARESTDKRVKILIVEDIETTRNMYARNLGLKGDYLLETAADLAEATSALEARTFHVALVDIMLAGPEDTANRDGTQVLDLIHELDEGTRAVVLSAQKEPQQVREYLKGHEAFDYLEKGDLLESGIGKMHEYVAEAAANSPVGAEPSWEAVVAALAGDCDEPAFVAEVMGKLKFKGGFENLQRALTSSVRYLLPLVPVDGNGGLVFDEARQAMTARFWSKGQGCAVEFILSGKEGDEADGAVAADGLLVAREKRGLSVVVAQLPEARREAFAGPVR